MSDSAARLKAYRKQVDRSLAQYRSASDTWRRERSEAIKAEDVVSYTELAQEVFQNVAQNIQQRAHTRIASIVTRCLVAIFDEPYEFEIRFDRKRGKTEARMLFKRDGLVLEDPTDEAGGGVIDVAAFALRVACLVLSRPKSRLLVVLDEPFKFVSEGYRPLVREMLEMLSKELGVQFIMVTHIDELKTGKVIEVK